MIHVFHDMGQTCLIRSSCRPDVQSALNSGPCRPAQPRSENWPQLCELAEANRRR